MEGHCDAGVVNRELGCAAGSSESGVHSFPCQSMTWSGGCAGHSLPPDVAVVGLGAVGEDRVALDRRHRVRVRLVAVFGATPKKPASGFTARRRPSSPNFIQAMSSPDGLDRPVGQRRDQHRQVGLAAGRGERPADVLDLSLGRGELEDQHVLGEPALVAGHRGGDSQREALLAEQRVPAVPRAERPDLAALRVVDDVLVVGVAGPRHVLLAVVQRSAERVDAGDELAVLCEHLKRRCPHPGHDPHRDRDIGRVGELHADVGDRGAEWAHREGDDVHGAPAH